MNIVLIILFVILFFFGIFEKHISNKWYHIYYKFGIPIFIKKIDHNNLKFPASSDPDFEIKEQNENLILFRYGKFKKLGPQFYDFSPFRGFININSDSKQRKYYCFINWDIFFLIIFLVYSIFLTQELFAKFFLAGIALLIIYVLFEKLNKLNRVIL